MVGHGKKNRLRKDLPAIVINKKRVKGDYSDAPEAPVRIVGKHLSGLREALRQHICGEAA